MYILSFFIGITIPLLYQWVKKRSILQLEQQLIQEAENKCQLLFKDIEKKEFKALKMQAIAEEKFKVQIDNEKKQLKEKQLSLQRELESLKKERELLKQDKRALEDQRTNLEESHQQVSEKLQTLSSLTKKEAKDLLINQIRNECSSEIAQLILRTREEALEEEEQKAKRILATSMNRLILPTVSEVTINTVTLPNDEIKGRIIGREGRNIRTLERLTGITFLVDDTPGAVVLSGFDPIRLYVAKTALTSLIKDGRIHPTSIEDSVAEAEKTTVSNIRKAGQDAALRIGASDLHPELITLLGQLKFRTSYGQNVLDHSLEVAQLMGLMACELDLTPSLAKRIGLLHDIGKAVSHEIEGPHALVGHDLALKYGESHEVANGIGCHHGEIEPGTIEASLCATADKISGSRPGSRSDNLQEYIKRVQRLEKIAHHFPGVDHVYALQAGREIRVIVLPEMIDDSGAILLARDISKKIEKELNYPGQIKVTVIREKRVVEYAT